MLSLPRRSPKSRVPYDMISDQTDCYDNIMMYTWACNSSTVFGHNNNDITFSVVDYFHGNRMTFHVPCHIRSFSTYEWVQAVWISQDCLLLFSPKHARVCVCALGPICGNWYLPLRTSTKALSVVCSLHAKNCPSSSWLYSSIACALSLTSLADRRVKANLTFLHKLIDGSINAPSLLDQVNFKVPHRATRSRVPFTVPLHCTNYGKNKPIDSMMLLANEDSSFLSLP